MRRYAGSCILALVAAWPVARPDRLAAQEAVTELGIRLRIATREPDRRRVTGVLLGVTPDSLTLRDARTGAALAWSFGQLDRIDASRGRHSFVGRGAIRGLVGGAAFGGLRSLVDCGRCDPAETIVANAALGFFVGGAIGAILRIERWRPVSVAEVATLPTAAGTATASPIAGLHVDVRIRPAGGEPLEGTLIATTTDSITVQPRGGGAARTVHRGALVRFEVARGRRGHTVEGLVAGAVIGGVGGFALGSAAESDDSFVDVNGPTLAVVGLLVGAVPGAIVGSLIRTQRWEPAGVTIAPEVGPAPGGGLRLGLRLGRP